GREYFATRMTPLFDPLAAAQAASAQTLAFLLDPARVNRVAWQHARDAAQPGVDDVLDALLRGTWQRDTTKDAAPGAAAVQFAANWTTLDALLALVDAGALHPQVDAQVRAKLGSLREWLVANAGSGATAANRRQAAALIAQYFADPKSVKLRPLPVVPPGAPI
ncbi:MAG TPA: zinc-dependent metalloprotease, partial [Tahibacter sp.]|nr:zinc-dependent metalloprotease [Tahibacter sp.]